MANIFKSLLSFIGGGAGPGMYASNKSFRKGANQFIGGRNPKVNQLQNYAPGQQGIFDEMINSLQGSYGQGLDVFKQYLDPNSEAYKNFEAPYMRQFNEETIPNLAERFAGAGANSGALSSSGFGQSLGAAGAGLQEKLARMKSEMQMKAAQGIFDQNRGALQAEPFSHYEDPGSEGQGANLVAMFIKALMGGR